MQVELLEATTETFGPLGRSRAPGTMRRVWRRPTAAGKASGPGAAGGAKPTWRHRPLSQGVLRLMQPLAPTLPPPWRQLTVRSSLMPRTSCGAPMRSGVHGGRIFTAVEHWNAECVGWHVCKRGDRFAALQPIAMGLAGLSRRRGSGAGLADGSRPICRTTSPTRSSSASSTPDQRRRRDPWSHLPQHRPSQWSLVDQLPEPR